MCYRWIAMELALDGRNSGQVKVEVLKNPESSDIVFTYQLVSAFCPIQKPFRDGKVTFHHSTAPSTAVRFGNWKKLLLHSQHPHANHFFVLHLSCKEEKADLFDPPNSAPRGTQEQQSPAPSMASQLQALHVF